MRLSRFGLLLLLVLGLEGAAPLGIQAWSDEPSPSGSKNSSGSVKTVYPKKSSLDFEGTEIEGELRKPGEFYFQRKQEEKFENLTQKRKNFHREMLRDVVSGR